MRPAIPFSELATNPNVPPEVGLALRAKFGLDDPIYLRYLHWLAAMVQGDWGFSFVSRMNVDTLILQRLPTTLYVIGSAQLLALLIAIPVGVYAATRPYSIFDQIANTLAFIGFSLPTFFTGILFILIFSVKLDWLPFVYTTDIKATGIGWFAEHGPAGHHARDGARPVPGGVDDPLRALGHAGRDPPRLRHHRPRQGPRPGQGHRQACDAQRHDSGRHPDRAADYPPCSAAPSSPSRSSAFPGIGSLLISSILSNDTPVVMAVTFVFACLVVLFNLIADVLYGWLDPRISYR